MKPIQKSVVNKTSHLKKTSVLQKKDVSHFDLRNETKTVKSSSYQVYLIESLKDPDEAVSYLNAALEDGDINLFLLALQNVIKAQEGMSNLAEKTNKSRTSLYKTLSKTGNPYLKNVNELLIALGMHLTVVPLEKKN